MLKKTLKSIANQNLSQNFFETIVVDNGSTDETKEVVDSYIGNICNLRYYYEETPGLHVGRHKGLKEANASILVYADDDIEAFPSWLEAIAEVFEDKRVTLAGGKVLPTFETKPPEWLFELWSRKHDKEKVLSYLSIIDLGDETKEIAPCLVFGCNFSIRKSTLIEAGGFHPDAMPENLIHFRGDGETHVSNYIATHHYTSLYHPKASVSHFIPKGRMTVDYFCERAYKQGISDSFAHIRKAGLGLRLPLFLKALKCLLLWSFNSKLQAQYQMAYLRGYIRHQRNVKMDCALLDWVTKSTFLD
jgi:glucosyl-dolichyl phosphate glucuronosyltransferase